MITRRFKGYTLSNIGSPAFPLFAVFNPQGEDVRHLHFPSDFKDEVWRRMYASAESTGEKRVVFKELMKSLGKAYRSGLDCVEKLWNNGKGSLEMFKLYPAHGILLVNKSLCNKWDKKHMEEALNILDDVDLEIKYVNYGYPTYYDHSFGLSLLDKA